MMLCQGPVSNYCYTTEFRVCEKNRINGGEFFFSLKCYIGWFRLFTIFTAQSPYTSIKATVHLLLLLWVFKVMRKKQIFIKL